MPASQTRRTLILAALALVASALLLAVLLHAAPPAQAQTPQAAASSSGAERWLHVKVDGANDGEERVRVNVPLSLARTVLNSVKHDQLDHGIVRIHHGDLDDVDIRGILKALKSSQDGEYVTVEQHDCTVHVSKQAGMLLIHVTDHSAARKEQSEADKPERHRHHHQNVDVRVPLEVADALFSGSADELNVGAALDLLSRHESIELVSVKDGDQTIHVWMDTKTTQD